jgi:hypothetical protein
MMGRHQRLPRGSYREAVLSKVHYAALRDYADQRRQTGLGGADCCEECGIILVI